MGLFGVVRKAGTRLRDEAARVLGPTAAAGAGGAAGGLLLDDIPVIGPALDPTSGGNGGLGNMIKVALAIGIVIALGTLFDISIGGDGQ